MGGEVREREREAADELKHEAARRQVWMDGWVDGFGLGGAGDSRGQGEREREM